MNATEGKSFGPSAVRRARRALAWLEGKLIAMRPGPRAFRGAAAGAVLAAVALETIEAVTSHSGAGWAVEALVGASVGLVGALLLGALTAAVVAILRKVPTLVVGAVVGAALAVVLVSLQLSGQSSPSRMLLFMASLVPLEALGGFGLGALFGGELSGARPLKKFVTLGALLVSAGGNAALVAVLTSGGSDAHLIAAAPDGEARPSAAVVPNPAERGPFEVKTLFYGSGTDARRPEFGPSVGLKTRAVDASLLLPDLKGFKAATRKWYWGFDKGQFPLNGRVWAPAGEGPFPVVIVVHGNHTMEEYSDPGYAYLGELLASRGFLVASVDENFLNGSWSGDLRATEMAARAWLILEHLKLFREWNGAEGNPFFRKVDLDNVGLVGHSRGGEAVSLAAALNGLSRYPEDANLRFDYNFSIRGVVGIAPSNDFYKPAGQPAAVKNVNYLVLQGGHDGDVAFFMGARQYERAKFDGPDYHFKASVYMYRANHGQFNTVWGDNDWGGGLWGELLDRKPLMPAEEQRRAASVYISAFFEASLRGKRDYVPLFRDRRAGAAWLPAGAYVTRFRDSTFAAVSDYEEDADVATTTLRGGAQSAEGFKTWREEVLQLRLKSGMSQANNAVRLGWEKAPAGQAAPPASYRIALPGDYAKGLGRSSRLALSLANAGDDKAVPSVTVELAAADGAAVRLPLRRFGALGPRLVTRYSKFTWIDTEHVSKPAELLLQTFEAPLADFVGESPQFDPAKLQSVALLFDRGEAGAVVVDEVGFSTDLPRPARAP